MYRTLLIVFMAVTSVLSSSLCFPVWTVGGVVLDKQSFDPSCSHIIVGSPLRNEKYLAAMAAGKWILHRSYLEACRSVGHFIQVRYWRWFLFCFKFRDVDSYSHCLKKNARFGCSHFMLHKVVLFDSKSGRTLLQLDKNALKREKLNLKKQLRILVIANKDIFRAAAAAGCKAN